ncbi:unnamed protein product [Penicillium roqueforti FM164]|uniref:Genomic scaffold, ProqFM164S03 n=1 Tax=Penicillium roqueforti (strain FM164) TaxID=1365484 RepID=W6QJU8_PENRF|nr:unnamed protein product [Penicillium roqueforti FM164]
MPQSPLHADLVCIHIHTGDADTKSLETFPFDEKFHPTRAHLSVLLVIPFRNYLVGLGRLSINENGNIFRDHPRYKVARYWTLG